MIKKDVKNPFWNEVFNAWMKYGEKPDNSVLEYPVWNSFLKNKNILCKKKEFINKGIVYVNDLICPNGGFLSYTDFRALYDVKVNYVDY